ncbi:hypothetical protein NEDG_01403 [Nematocida displodere]|uniref:t-SNARE coiled-coil homology domain-containing protein n=1 Tax=Nematocida displodere TaxID=1805483 RepID=A0A177ED63_9MICR|nr:hypothetical protein NEDG_01403 [Nematocida displodere]
MDRTAEFRRVSQAPSADVLQEDSDSPAIHALQSAKELKNSLLEYTGRIERATSQEYADIEKEAAATVSQVPALLALLYEIETEENALFIGGVATCLKIMLQRTEIKLESKRHKTRRSTLNIALEPEKAPSIVKIAPVMLQMLQEENVKILERVQYSDREVTHVRRQISEIDTLQKLITQEIFSQDERIDSVLGKTGLATQDVRISRTYIRNAGEKRKSARRFLSLLFLIFAVMILLLHLTK